MRFKATGVAAWWVQRASAVCMLLFMLFVPVALWLRPRPSFAAWKDWLGHPAMRLALLAFFAALLSHLWVGLRDVLLDYARPAAVQTAMLAIVGLALCATAIWVVVIVFRLHA